MNKTGDIKALTEKFFKPTLITVQYFRALMKSYVVDEDTADEFLLQLSQYELDLRIDKDCYDSVEDFCNLFTYSIDGDCLIEEAFLGFSNSEEILSFIENWSYEEDDCVILCDLLYCF